MNPYIANRNKYLASAVNNSKLTSKRAFITGFDPDKWSISLEYAPNTSEEGYNAGAVQIPLSSQWVGNGWGLCLAPILGTQVDLLFEDGNQHQPVGMSFLFDNEHPPIAGVKSGEAWLKHETGSLIKLTADGQVTVSANTQLNLAAPIISMIATTKIQLQAPTIESIASVTIHDQAPIINETGNVTITGTITANDGTFTMNDSGFTTSKNISTTQEVTAGSIGLKSHKHGGVQSGGDETGIPV